MFQKYVEIISDTRALLVCMGSSELKGSMNLWNVSHISYNGMSKINNWKKYPFCISQQPRNIINSHWGDRVSTWGVGVYGKIQNLKFIIDFLLFTVNCFCIVTATKFGMWYDWEKFFFQTSPVAFQIPIFYSNLNCSKVLDLRNLQERVKRAFCFKNCSDPSLFE